MGDVVLLRDYQNPKDIERLRQALEREAAEILAPFVETESFTCEHIPYGGQGIDGMNLGPKQS